ncbi:hypothetical protein VHUM_02758 [Vanrija humicola]|uniref:Major facilitator superfamily (MFS) profile domain-containing protein n=1 Tax=Vanrija humicola TaxID=5417 RepID=A0A7D8UYK6_VANHU|nr:hypothetical protein VHUM_02758 [Vanrija humicola]
MTTSPAADERTPLLGAGAEATAGSTPLRPRSVFPPLARVLAASLLISLTFSVTQTALVYSFRTMTCDEYYRTREWTGVGDQCAVRAIEARTAERVSLMSGLTTAGSIVNLFTSAWFIQRYGVKAAMFQQTIWAALRNLTQIYAQTVGGKLGMDIITTTQLFNVLGSAGGYQLCANSYVAILSADQARTANFGVLSGIMMLGSGLGYSVGGAAERLLGYLAPFQLAFVLLVSCTVFGMFFLPYVAPSSDVAKPRTGGFLSPLKTFVPRTVVAAGGRTRKSYNLTFLAVGTFCSVLATGYVPLALQLVGTNLFGFTPDTSGYMMTLTLVVRVFFLSLCFPRIITVGRRWFSSAAASPLPPPASVPTPSPPSPKSQPAHPEDADQAEAADAAGQPAADTAPELTDTAHGAAFDLVFLRYSILLDGVLTGATTFLSRGWHVYLAASVLPFASGTGSAAKGVVMELVRPEERADALSAIALVERLAQVTTIGLFGYVFAWFTKLGVPTLVFAADAAIAILAFVLLLPVKMLPPSRPGTAAATA